MSLAVGTIALGLCGSVLGHGNIVWPPAWQDANGTFGLKSGQLCSSGAEVEGIGRVTICNWYTNDTFIPGEPTLPEDMLTYPDKAGGPEHDWTHMPWRAPGSAHVNSPCGVPGGVKEGLQSAAIMTLLHNINILQSAPRYNRTHTSGDDLNWIVGAEKFKFKNVVTTQWKIGSRVEAFFGLLANHGGGYSYRLCKVPPEGNSGLTEECFQKTPLHFSGNQQWVQYGEDESTRVYFVANRTDIGTTPKGSQWTKIPMPACAGYAGGHFDQDELCASGTQFEPPAPGVFGYGARTPWSKTFNFSVGDNLDIPDDLEPGEYALSFRLDCEQLPQIYSSCSSINLVK